MSNFAAYFVQVAVLAGLGACLPRLLRVHHPRTQLVYCQALLALCLALPWIQPWRRQAILAPLEVGNTAPWMAASRDRAPEPFPWDRAAIAILTAGAAVRAAWLGLGLLRLRRYRQDSAPMSPLPSSISEAQRRAATTAAVSLAPGCESPVTFGWRYPVILLPAGFRALAPDAQLAIATHELVHVRRRDWLWMMMEEAASVALWFHPAVWWLTARIRLLREQAVDQEVVALLGGSDPYVNCLLDMAGAPPRLDLAPAPLFLRRRHLSQRIQSLLEEVTVSKSRIALSYSCAAAVLAGALQLSIALFPMVGQAQVSEDGAGVRVDAGAKLVYRTPVVYPAAARTRKVEGTVTVELTLAQDGTVADARVVSGPDELRKAALSSVLEWHYDIASAPQRIMATIGFRMAPDGGAAGPVIGQVNVDGLTADLRETVRARLSPFVGMRLTPEVNREINSIISSARAGRVVWGTDAQGVTVLSVSLEAPRTASGADFEPATDGTKRIRVGGNVQSSKLISKPAPEYPALAKQARIQGTVRFNVLIAKDGTIKALSLVAGHPLLVESAQKAVSRWQYQPTLLNGEPVEVITVIDVNYTLTE
ncbi:MAG: M56 family metallopeptidase [Bryobacteraceae bacterium]